MTVNEQSPFTYADAVSSSAEGSRATFFDRTEYEQSPYSYANAKLTSAVGSRALRSCKA